MKLRRLQYVLPLGWAEKYDSSKPLSGGECIPLQNSVRFDARAVHTFFLSLDVRSVNGLALAGSALRQV